MTVLIGSGRRVSLPAWGEWIEIQKSFRRTLHSWSLPAWGEWIEIVFHRDSSILSPESLPAWGEWIEMGMPLEKGIRKKSLPAWGEWIEITTPEQLL